VDRVLAGQGRREAEGRLTVRIGNIGAARGLANVATAVGTEKRTVTPGTGLRKASVTVAVTQCSSPTVLVAVGGFRVRVAGAPGVQVFEAVSLGSPSSWVVFALVSAKALIVSVPAVVPVYVKLASPFASVTADPLAVFAPLTENWTTMPGVGLPNWSSTVAVTVCRLPTSFSSVSGSSVSVAGGPGVQVLAASPKGSPASWVLSVSVSAKAWIASTPGAVGPS
jgi:hypothetical protein